MSDFVRRMDELHAIHGSVMTVRPDGLVLSRQEDGIMRKSMVRNIEDGASKPYPGLPTMHAVEAFADAGFDAQMIPTDLSAIPNVTDLLTSLQDGLIQTLIEHGHAAEACITEIEAALRSNMGHKDREASMRDALATYRAEHPPAPDPEPSPV